VDDPSLTIGLIIGLACRTPRGRGTPAPPPGG
jgi:hypothetical protein